MTETTEPTISNDQALDRLLNLDRVTALREFAEDGVLAALGSQMMSTLDEQVGIALSMIEIICAHVAEMADEVRTRRLVVEDEHGVERIYTKCDANRVLVALNTFDNDDRLRVGDPTQVSVFLEAEVDVKGNRDGKPSARSAVQCYTGDNGFSVLEQRSTVETTRFDRVRIDRGQVALDQGRSAGRADDDSALRDVSASCVELGPDGVVDREIGGDVLAYAPMHRVPRGGTA